jgi:hypothetical protein
MVGVIVGFEKPHTGTDIHTIAHLLAFISK